MIPPLLASRCSEYGAPVIIVPKPDGSWRFCTDFRRLNAITQEAKYPLPRIETCLDHLGKAKYFSKIDLRSGYWQMRIHPQDIHKTAFRTQYGHFEWMVMPFGLQGAPSVFQRMMNHYLRHYLGKFVLVYLDDILIFSNSKEEHLQHIQQVLQILRDKKLFAKGSKCDFFKKEVQFLGFRVKSNQITTDPEKIKAIQDWPQPSTVRELRSFLGLCNFYRRFIEKHAEIAKPLTNILKSTEFEQKFNTPFKKLAPISFNEDHVTAFNKLKTALTTAPCLVIFDPEKPTEVWADASWENSTVGGVLMQDHGSGLQPVAFLSKVMSAAESRYPTFEQELLALKKALEEWRHYLLPITFTARTDHNGLKYLKTQKHLSERQWHWLAFFSEYHFDLLYRAGKQMTVPDSLSRRPKTTDDINELLRVHGTEEDDAIFKIKIQTSTGKSQKILLKMTKKYPEIVTIPSVLDYSGDPDYGEIYENLQKLEKIRKPSLQLYNINTHGNLIWIDRVQQERICVPVKYRSIIISEHHDTPLGAHFGMDKTYQTIKQRYIWPNMRHHINQFVRSCDTCQKNKSFHQKPFGTPQIPPVPEEPWEHISIDFCGPFPKTKKGNNYIMGIICNLTREAILVPCLNTITAE